MKMLKKTLTAATLAASTLFAGTAFADPVYLIATISVNDWDKYMGDYGSVAIPAIVEAGGEFLVAAKETTVAEGTYPHNWTVVVKFPSEEVAMGFYTSETYQGVIGHRHAATDIETSVLMLAPQFVPPSE